tara:strand:- start:192224 stop:192397 length:174 start_codon:yes stop_codon:yes gene_type:complete
MSQLEYSKLILSKIRHYPEIFRKEYQKFRSSFGNSPRERKDLELWVSKLKSGDIEVK